MNGRENAALAALMRVAGAVRDFHPIGAPPGWDESVDAAGTRIAAGDPIAATVAALLDTLGDPACGVRDEVDVPPDRTAAPAEGALIEGSVRRFVAGVTVFDGPAAATNDSTHDLDPLLERSFAGLDPQRPLIVDLRGCSGPWLLDGLTRRLAAAFAGDLAVPGVRAVSYPELSGERGWLTTADSRQAGRGSVRPRCAVIVDADSGALRLALALRAAYGAVLVQAGRLAPSPAPPTRVTLGGGAVACVRTTEAILAGQPVDCAPDVVVDAGDPVAAALAALADLSAGPVSTGQARVRPNTRASRAGGDGRWAALGRLDAAIRSRFAYHHLLDVPWGQVIEDAAAELRGAAAGAEVELALARAVVRMSDGHAMLDARALTHVVGRHRPDVRLIDLDGEFVVSHVGVGVPAIRPGDVVATVDGVAAAERAARIAALLSGSTTSGHRLRVGGSLLSGPPGGCAVGVVSPDGSEHTHTLPRTVAAPVQPTSSLPVCTVLPAGVGYLDLGRLVPREVAPAFDVIAATPATVFDLRRYPRSTGLLVAGRLTTTIVVGALLRRPVPTAHYEASTPWWQPAQQASHMRQLVRPLGRCYAGRVVVLIDAGTISQGEHCALLLEAAANATFVGSATNGTNGNIAVAELGSGRSVVYTGVDVTHADGRQLQRVGVQPQVAAAPTREGLAAGLDEVLDAGVAVAAG